MQREMNMKFLSQIICCILLFSNIFYASEISHGWYDLKNDVTLDDRQGILQQDQKLHELFPTQQQKSHNQSIIKKQPTCPPCALQINKNEDIDQEIDSTNLNKIDIFVFIGGVISYASAIMNDIDQVFNQNKED